MLTRGHLTASSGDELRRYIDTQDLERSEKLEISHRCGNPWCLHMMHLLLEIYRLNIPRELCFKRARESSRERLPPLFFLLFFFFQSPARGLGRRSEGGFLPSPPPPGGGEGGTIREERTSCYVLNITMSPVGGPEARLNTPFFSPR